MPFFIGYFGKSSPEYFDRLKHIAEENAIAESAITISNNNLHVFAGTYKHEIQSDYVIPIGNSQGLLVGKVFDNDAYQRIADFKLAVVDSVINNPQFLTKNFWGRYSGILYNQVTQKITLVRDPLGLNTQFYMQTKDGILFATDIALIYDCLDTKPSLNLHYFADYIIGKNYALSSTPFDTIFELQPGIGLQFSLNGSMQQEPLWDFNPYKNTFIVDKNEFEQELLHTLKQSMKAWVDDSKGVCVELSGGLDSSGVMILLREVLSSNQKLIGVNYIDSKVPSANEISYAQEVADICDAPLHFIDWQSASLFNDSQSNWRSNKPTTFLLFGAVENQLRNLALSQNCSQIMNGQGGDHVFLAPPYDTSLADYWLQKGIKGSGLTLKELSAYFRMPLSTLLWKNIKGISHYFTGRIENQKISLSFLSQEFRNIYILTQDYLESATKNHYPSKALHIQSLAHAVSFADRNQRIPGMIFDHPLLAQPVVELGLKIPTYQSFSGGHDRILFRNAISRLKKTSALWRTHKGDTTASMVKQLAANIHLIEEMLKHSILINSGMINKAWLEENIQQIKHGKIDNLWLIIKLITAECWLDQWKLKY